MQNWVLGDSLTSYWHVCIHLTISAFETVVLGKMQEHETR